MLDATFRGRRRCGRCCLCSSVIVAWSWSWLHARQSCKKQLARSTPVCMNQRPFSLAIIRSCANTFIQSIHHWEVSYVICVTYSECTFLTAFAIAYPRHSYSYVTILFRYPSCRWRSCSLHFGVQIAIILNIRNLMLDERCAHECESKQH